MTRKILSFLPFAALMLIPVETNAQACNPQYPATCVQTFNPYQRSYQAPTLRLYVPPTPPPQTWSQPTPSLGGATIYTDQYGNRLGYGHGSGNTIIYTDQYGNILGREQRF